LRHIGQIAQVLPKKLRNLRGSHESEGYHLAIANILVDRRITCNFLIALLTENKLGHKFTREGLE
jgi:hypothetical protein